jgi:hypothetical protein
MRLVNTNSLELEEFLGQDTPPYIILSHTWQKEEVTLQEFQVPKSERRTSGVVASKGYRKVVDCCRVAKADGYDYIWADTCWYVSYFKNMKLQ